MDSDKKSAWLRKLDEECPYQVVLPPQQLADDSAILDFLIAHVEKFDMYVEDDYAAFVRYCFADPLDAEIFRSRFEPKAERFRLAGGTPPPPAGGRSPREARWMGKSAQQEFFTASPRRPSAAGPSPCGG